MKIIVSSASVLALFALGSGCASDAGGPTGPGVTVKVAPLTLPGLTNVCYGLQVQNDAGQTVWQQTGVCADQYGDLKSDITYIGTCDASDNDDVAGASNTVTITIEDIWAGAPTPVADSEWQNPCGIRADGSPLSPNGDGNGPCQLKFDCVENADVLVPFNLTIMRDANQGFFDVAVNFEDVFCSSKVDCKDDAGDPLQLLFNPKKGDTRDDTIVIGRACTAGVGADTQIQASETIIACGLSSSLNTTTSVFQPLITFTYDPTPEAQQGQGNVTVSGPLAASGLTPALPLASIAWQNANYTGTEQLTDPTGASYGKVYMNEAIGFDFEALKTWFSTATYIGEDGQPTLIENPEAYLQTCRLFTAFTATDGAGLPATGDGLDLYPYAASFHGDFTDTAEGTFFTGSSLGLWSWGTTPGGNLACSQHPLDGSGKGNYSTQYSEIEAMVGDGFLAFCMTSDGVGEPLTSCAK